jgi:alkaline phosphatase D
MANYEEFQGEHSRFIGPVWAGPLLGECGESDAFVWAQGKDEGALTLALKDDRGEVRTFVETPDPVEWLCVKFHVTGLVAGKEYGYSISNAAGETTPVYALRAAPGAAVKKVKVVFGSCFAFYDTQRLTIFEQMRMENAAAVVFTGDNCYFRQGPDPKNESIGSEWVNQPAMMKCQLRHRNNESLRDLVNSVSTLAIWDDHDFGPNNSDATDGTGPNALAVFKRVWANRGYAEAGIYSSVRVGPVELFLIDDRYHRTPPPPANAAPHILGDAQYRWLTTALKSSQAPVKVIVSGSVVLPQFPGAPGVTLEWEGWMRNAPGERAALLKFIADNSITGVLFATGDLHRGYLYFLPGAPLGGGRVGPDFWEVVPSPLGNFIWPHGMVHVTPPDQPHYDAGIFEEHAQTNYAVFDVDLDRAGAEIELRLKSEQGDVLFEQPVPLATLGARPDPTPLRVIGWRGDKAYFFKGGQYYRYTTGTVSAVERADASYPKPVAGRWPGLARADAGITLAIGKAFVFSGNGYVRYSADAKNPNGNAGSYTLDRDHPRYIEIGFPGFWKRDLDAAAAWPDGKLYFFRGAEVISCDPATLMPDLDCPKPIAGLWPGLDSFVQGGIDAVVVWSNEYAYFFKGADYVLYKIGQGIEPGYPKPIAQGFPDLAAAG